MHYSRLSGFSDEISESIDEQFRVLNKLKIDYFEPRGINGKNIAFLSETEVLQLKNKMKLYGIKVSSIGSPIGKVKLEDSFEEHFELFKHVVWIAKELETGYTRIFSFYHEKGREWTREDRTEILDRMRKMIDYASQHKVILLHENEKDIYGDTVERCLDLMRELSGSNFQAVFDPANFVQCKQDTLCAYESLKEYIAYMHIKDAKFEDGSVVPSGEGNGNIEIILRKLMESGYQGFLSLEPHLGSFLGLSDLEIGDMLKKLPESGEGTFTLAYYALERILGRI